MKKIIGIVLAILGLLGLLGGISNAFALYDLSDGHDLSKFVGGLALSALTLIAGVALVRKKAAGPSK